jgi:hypothetical protein
MDAGASPQELPHYLLAQVICRISCINQEGYPPLSHKEGVFALGFSIDLKEVELNVILGIISNFALLDCLRLNFYRKPVLVR